MSLQDVKMWLVETLHLAKDALHIYVALIVFFGACLLFRWKASQWKPWLCVLAAALVGEVWDLTDTYLTQELFDFEASVKDILNTMLVPTLLMVLARYTMVFGKPRSGAGR